MASTSPSYLERIKALRCGSVMRSDTLTGCKMAFYLLRSCPFVLLLVGTVGNLLNIIVLSRKRMRQQPTAVYLIFLACSDLITSWTALTRNTLVFGWSVDIRDLSHFLCVMQHWIATGGVYFSANVLVLISLERMLLTKFPTTTRRKMTKKNALVASVVVLVYSFAINTHLVFGNTLKTIPVTLANNDSNESVVFECVAVSEEYLHFYERSWSLIGIALNALTMMIIIANNVVIIATLAVQRRRVQPSAFITAARRMYLERSKALTRMTVLLAVYFTVTTLPYCTFMYIVTNLPGSMPDEQFSFYVFGLMCLYYALMSNHSLNFFFYFSSGPMFKRELKAVWKDISDTGRDILSRATPPEVVAARENAIATVGAPGNTASRTVKTVNTAC